LTSTPAGKDWIFVSDAHFTGHEPEAMEAFCRFLKSEKESMGHLIILGDLFDFLFGFKSSFLKKKNFVFSDYLPILEALKKLYHQGIHIQYYEGNHDFFLNSFFSEQFGIDVEVHPHGGEEQLGGKKAFLAHGDLCNPGEWKYLVFRRILKNRWTYSLMHVAGPRLSRQVARWLSQQSYKKYHSDSRSHPLPVFREFAHQKFLEGFQIVLLGHSHVPEEWRERIDGREYAYFNVGDWMTHRSFLRFTPPDQFQLSRFQS
jgi:UDP-2,3-diacylglucosamine hydrolase